MAVLAQGLIAAAICLAFRFAGRGPLDVYYWIAVQGVIWIILVQALTSLAVWAYFRRQPASERHWWKTTLAPWIGFVAQVVVLYLCYKYLSSLAAGDVLYVKELGRIGPWGGFEIDITWLGIIGVLVPVLALVYAFYPPFRQAGQVRDGRPLHQRRRGVALSPVGRLRAP